MHVNKALPPTRILPKVNKKLPQIQPQQVALQELYSAYSIANIFISKNIDPIKIQQNSLAIKDLQSSFSHFEDFCNNTKQLSCKS